MRNKVAAVFVGLIIASVAIAGKPVYGPYRADVVSVYDGDTFKALLAIAPGQTNRVSIRVDGVDTPELRGKCPAEKAAARAARDFARQWLAGGPVTVDRVRNGKYAGRVVARVTVHGVDLAKALIDAGHGREYHGGKRKGWC